GKLARRFPRSAVPGVLLRSHLLVVAWRVCKDQKQKSRVRSDQAILDSDCITSRRTAADPFGRQLHAAGQRHSKAAVPRWSPHIPGMSSRNEKTPLPDFGGAFFGLVLPRHPAIHSI